MNKQTTFSCCTHCILKHCVVILVSFTLLYCGQIINAQPYQSIFGNEKTQFNIFYLFYSVKTPSGFSKKFNIQNDTIISQQLYKKINLNQEGEEPLFDSHTSYIGIREDINEGRVFVFMKPIGEMLTCDFGLSVGDTFFFPQYNIPFFPYFSILNTHNGFMIVDSVHFEEGKKIITFNDPFYIQGENIEQFKWMGDFYFPKFTFIEGIGPNFGPLGWLSEMQMLLCAYKDDDMIYMQREDLGCDYNNIGSSVGMKVLSQIKILPNPIINEFQILCDSNNLEEVYIYTIQGQCVIQKKIQDTSYKINTSILQSGIYLLKIKDNQGNIYSTKIIKI